RRTRSPLPEKPSDVLHARGLAGAAEREVADADHVDAGVVDALPAVGVQPVPQPHRPTIGQAEDAQPTATECRPPAPALAPNQGKVIGLQRSPLWRQVFQL